MRSYDDSDEDDRATLDELKAEPWMVDYLGANPSYTGWGPGDDYMSGSGDGWSSSISFASWKEFSITPDDLNECVNFYFELDRASKICEPCDGSGLNPETKVIADTFYDHGDAKLDFGTMTMSGNWRAARNPRGATGRRWCDAITQDEVDALVANGRLRAFDHETRAWKSVPRTAAEVNAANTSGARGMDLNHDGINRMILVETRAKRLGVYGMCAVCHGKGHVYTEPSAKLNLVLWLLHPRKGASRGARIHGLSLEDAAAARAWLAIAAARNAERFSKVASPWR